MSNALLATFQNQPAMISSGSESSFESFLTEASTTLARINVANDNPVMADDFWFSPDDWRSAYRPYIVNKAGILLIPVKGVLLHDVSFALGSWATGYVYLTKALERGIADPAVKGIAWIHDSPGGHVAGNFDLCDKIFAARGKKPMRAYASESSYSASYSLASAADTITVSRTGGVGSIGVVTVHYDYSKMLDKMGIKVTFTTYGKHKVDGNSSEPLSKDAEERRQARINELGEVFVSTVARNRGMKEQAVRDTEALTFTAIEAKSNGLADAIGSLDDAIAVFAADLSLNDEDETMSAPNKIVVNQTAVIETARAESAAAEKSRISAIIESDEGKKRPVAALAAALDTDMTVEQATKLLGKLAEEKPTATAIDAKSSRADRAFALAGHQEQGNSESGNQLALGKTSPANPLRLVASNGSRADRAFALSGKL